MLVHGTSTTAWETPGAPDNPAEPELPPSAAAPPLPNAPALPALPRVAITSVGADGVEVPSIVGGVPK